MLPDPFQLKTEARRRFDGLLRQMVNRYLGVVSEAPRSTIHEGRRTVIVRQSGEVDEMKLFQATTQYSIRPEEIPTITLDELTQRLDVAAREMAKQMSTGFFQNVSEAVDKIGNTVDAKGRGFTPELVLEVYEKIWIEFDEDGRPQLPTLVMAPSQQELARKVFEQLDTDPQYKERSDRLFKKKREEWLAREAARKLD